MLRPSSATTTAVGPSRNPARLRCLIRRPLSVKVHQIEPKGACFEDAVDNLADRAYQSSAFEPDYKFIIGIAGAPGSGKSALATKVCERLNQVASRNLRKGQDGKDIAVVVPMDGFHYYKHELDRMPNPQEAHLRRGADWTFDAVKFVKCIREIRSGKEVLVPSFDHKIGDPVTDDIRVLKHHRIILVEGNYVLLDKEPWIQLQKVFDDTWYVECPIDVAMERVFQRQVGNGLSPEESRVRIRENDKLNGELIATSKGRAEVVVSGMLPFKASKAKAF